MNYHNLTYPDQNNGDGLRVVLWLSGCSHHCKGCQNPQTWNPDNGIPFDEKAKKELFEELEKDYISGITFTGGDPLYKDNLNEVLNLCKEVKEKFTNKTIWLYSGYSLEDIINKLNEYMYAPFSYGAEEFLTRYEIITYCDVLIDGEYKEELRDITLKWRGSSNQRVVDLKESLKQNKVVLYCD